MVMEGRRPPARWAIAAAGLIALASGCSTYIGTTAASFMQRARDSDDPNIRYLAYKNLASPRAYDNDQQKDDAVRLLIDGLEPGREPAASRAMICRTLGELRRPEARDPLVKAVEDPDPTIRGEACRALGKVGTIDDARVLSRIMAIDRQADCRIAAIEGIGELRTNDPMVYTTLVENMEHPDPAVRLASLRALRKLTGKDLGVESKPWKQYVNELAAAKPASAPATATASAPPSDGQARRTAGPR